MLALSAAVAAMGCNLADTVVLWPPGGPPQPNGAIRRVVISEGKEIEVWRVPPPSNDGTNVAPNAYVLRFYGNADRADFQVAHEAAHFSRLNDRGIELWGVNYPGYGGSAGPATLRGVASAAVAAYDAMAADAKGKPIFAFGTSLGTTAALHVAATRDVRGLLLVNPPPLKQLVVGEYGWWNLWLLAKATASAVPDELDSLANARRCHATPAIFVSAERDEVVPPKYQQQIIAAYAGPKEVIMVPGGSHNDPPPPETQSQIAEAITRMIWARH